MRNGTTAPPGYVLPSRPRWQGGWNIRAVVGAVLAFVLAASASTEWLAIQLNNPVEMGDPLTWIDGTAVFQPFAALVLWKHFAGSRLISSSVRKDIWIAFAATIAGGLLLAFVTYWFLSLIRDRKSTDSLMNLHGSATWATREDIKKLGLLDATDGVYVGGWRDPATQGNPLPVALGLGTRPLVRPQPKRQGRLGYHSDALPMAAERLRLRPERRELGSYCRVSATRSGSASSSSRRLCHSRVAATTLCPRFAGRPTTRLPTLRRLRTPSFAMATMTASTSTLRTQPSTSCRRASFISATSSGTSTSLASQRSPMCLPTTLRPA